MIASHSFLVMRLRPAKLHRCLSQQTNVSIAEATAGSHVANSCSVALYLQRSRQYASLNRPKQRGHALPIATSYRLASRPTRNPLCTKRCQSTALAEKDDDDPGPTASPSPLPLSLQTSDASSTENNSSTGGALNGSTPLNGASSLLSDGEQEVSPRPLTTSDCAEETGQVLHCSVKELLTTEMIFGKLKALLASTHGTLAFDPCHSTKVLLPRFAASFGLVLVGPCSLEKVSKGKPDDRLKTLDLSDVEKICEDCLAPSNLPSLILDYKSMALIDTPWVVDKMWGLVKATGQYRPDTLPDLRLVGQAGGVVDAADTTNSRLAAVNVSNSAYNITVVQPIDESGNVELAFIYALLKYCDQILQAGSSLNPQQISFMDCHMFPHDFLTRACRHLNTRRFTIQSKALPTPDQSKTGLHLYSSQIHLQSHPLGKPGVWFTRKTAQRIALLRACEDMKTLLQKAYHAGQLVRKQYQMFASYWGETVDGPPDQSKDRYFPRTITLSGEVLSNMIVTLRKANKYPLDLSQAWKPTSEVFAEIKPRPALPGTASDSRKRVEALPRRSRLDPNIQKQRDALPVRQPEYVREIRRAVADSQVTIVRASTGSGKTTQIPQLLFEHDKLLDTPREGSVNVVCTQPRRVSTVSVAHRVATEMATPIGSTVGYSVRFDNQEPRSANGINYMTSGYLLRLIELDHLAILSKYTHIILDEVHERDIDTDLIITALSNMLRHPPAEIPQMPKIILMSATLDLAALEQYFDGVASVSSVNVPGKIFPVSTLMLEDVVSMLAKSEVDGLDEALPDGNLEQFLEKQQGLECLQTEDREPEPDNGALFGGTNTQLLTLLVQHILSTTSPGDILVFLPGLSEIDALALRLEETGLGSQSPDHVSGNQIFRLHSMLYETNYDVLVPIPRDRRRIILSTNIAETSITLPNVTAVLDTGLSRQSTYNQSLSEGTFGLRWISKAEVTQRKGRAGRTQPGMYFATYTQAQYEKMEDKPTPELLRSPLDSVLLRTQASKAFRIPRSGNDASEAVTTSALHHAPSPPDPADVKAAIQQICNLRALTPDAQTTAMGKVMACLPTRPSASKAVLYGLIFRCMNPFLFAAACREDLALLFSPQSTAPVVELKRQISQGSDSDTWAEWQAWYAYDRCKKNRDVRGMRQWTDSQYLRYNAYVEVTRIINQTYQTLLPLLTAFTSQEHGLDDSYRARNEFYNTPACLNVNSTNANLVKALSLNTAGNQIAYWNVKNWFTPRHGRVMPSPRSINHLPGGMRSVPAKLRREPGDILMYSHLRNSPDAPHPWVYDTSIVSPLAGLLFGEDVKLSSSDVLLLNDSMQYKIEVVGSSPVTEPSHVVKIIFEYRKALDRFLAHALSTITMHPRRLKNAKKGEAAAGVYNTFLQEADHPLRKLWVDSVVDILNIDATDREERTKHRVGEFEERLTSMREERQAASPESS